jgi:hypothetical protein
VAYISAQSIALILVVPDNEILLTMSNLQFQNKIRFSAIIIIIIIIIISRYNVVGIATSYGLDDRDVGVRVPVGARIFSSPRRPDGLCGPSKFLSNGYRVIFPEGKVAGA